jgi:hypothetical protein
MPARGAYMRAAYILHGASRQLTMKVPELRDVVVPVYSKWFRARRQESNMRQRRRPSSVCAIRVSRIVLQIAAVGLDRRPADYDTGPNLRSLAVTRDGSATSRIPLAGAPVRSPALGRARSRDLSRDGHGSRPTIEHPRVIFPFSALEAVCCFPCVSTWSPPSSSGLPPVWPPAAATEGHLRGRRYRRRRCESWG